MKNEIFVDVDKNKKEVENKIKDYENLSLIEKIEKFEKELDDLIIDIKNEDIDIILDYTSLIFFKLCLELSNSQKKELTNRLLKLYHKLKNLYFFNQMVSLYQKIDSIAHDIANKFNTSCLEFNVYRDIILESIYDYKKNKNSEFKTLGLNIKSTNIKKYEFLSNVLEEEIYTKDDIFMSYDLIIGDFDEGYTLNIKFNDKYIIINNAKAIKEMKELLKKYGIENNTWYDTYEPESKKIIHRALNSMTEEEKKKRDEERKKEEEENKIKGRQFIESLQNEEKYIKIKFQRTKKNTKIFKKIFFSLKEFILSNELVKDKILKILPYGSVTQCTCNEKSDVEMTIITKNYMKATKEDISQIYEDIKKNLEEKKNEEFELFSEGIRETKRTILLLLRHKETKTEIEINCNNFFSVMNSTLIRNYLVYDARALILINTIKDWSKIKNINSNNKHFLSSYCYTLMTIYFLQRMKDPLLPIISSYNYLIKINISEKEFFVERQLLHSSELMKNWHTQNKNDTVTTLLLKWMIFYLYLFNEDEYCIDISNQKYTFRFKEDTYLTSSVKESKLSAYVFIDMFDYTYNPGSYMLMNSSEYDIFKNVLKESIEQLLEGKKEFFLPRQ